MTSDRRTITNPPALHDPTPFGYSHAVSAPGETVYIGGQYASEATGAPAPGDFATQVDLAFDRLRSALEGVGLGYEHVVRLGTFIVDHDLGKLETLGKTLHALPHSRLRSSGRCPHRRPPPGADPERRRLTGPAGDAVRGGRGGGTPVDLPEGVVYPACSINPMPMTSSPAAATLGAPNRSLKTQTSFFTSLVAEELRAEGEAKGEAKGLAHYLLHHLERRGIPISDGDRDRITTCDAPDTLTRWIDRAITATSTAEVFAEEPDAQE